MKKLLTILLILISYISYGQEFDFLTRGNFYKRMSVYDSTAVANSIAAGSNSLANFYLKDSSLSGDRTVDLNNNILAFQNGGNDLLRIRSNSNNGQFIFLNTIGGTIVGQTDLALYSDDDNGTGFNFFSTDGTNQVIFQADATTNSIFQTAGTHTFNAGSTKLYFDSDSLSLDNGSIAPLLLINSGLGTEKSFIGAASSETFTASSYFIAYSNNADGYRFYSYASDGSNVVNIIGDAATRKIDVSGFLVLHDVSSGASSDNILTQDITGQVYKIPQSTFALADSSVWQTVFRSDSARRNLYSLIATKGTGSVTSIATGLGLSGGTITTSGTLLVDTSSASILSRQRAAATYAPISGGAYLPLAGGTMTGNLLFTDNTYDIGATGATRPRTGYFGTSLISPLVNGMRIVNNGTDTLDIGAGKKFATIATMTLAAGANNQTFTFPSTSATIARTDAAQTFTGNQTFSNLILSGGYFSTSGVNSVYHRENIAVGIAFTVNNPTTLTSGTRTTVQFNETFSPTSGTAIMQGFMVQPTINQTGGANGISRGILISPTLTAAADWRSLEITNNAQYAIYQSGASAKNYFNGISGIGAVPVTDKLEVTGNISLMAAGNKLKITEGSNGSVGQTTLVAGTKAITITGVATSTRAIVTLVSQGGTVTTTTTYAAVCTANTLTITALTNGGATNTLDTSILNYFIIN